MDSVIICGDRNWTNTTLIYNELKNLPISCIIIEGEAKGADSIGRIMAEKLGMTVKKFPADWKTYGKSAGPIRNIEMLKKLKKYKNSAILAFHNDIENSKGTKHMVSIGKKAKITVKIITE
jgi:hypothetical protein